MRKNANVIKSDLAKVDAHAVKPHEYDEAPELTDAQVAQSVLHHGGRVISRGRPKLARPKRQVTLRLDDDVVEHFRRHGNGWQTRINDALRRSARLALKKRSQAR